MSDNIKNSKEGKPATPGFSLLSFARLMADSGSSLSNRYFFRRINRLKNQELKFKIFQARRLDNRGFTVVELNIAIGISAVLSVAFLAIFTTFLVTSTRTNASIEMTSSSQILLRSITEELRYGGGVQQKNTIDDLNSDEPAGGWSTSNDTAVIITAVPALDASSQYIIDPAIDRPYYNEFIYYQEGSILYKRTLANPNAVGNKSVNSCPVKTDTCPGDRKLVETLENMSFTLYDQDNVVITDPLLTNLARSIKIDLALRKQVIGNPLEFDNSIRITLRNVF